MIKKRIKTTLILGLLTGTFLFLSTIGLSQKQSEYYYEIINTVIENHQINSLTKRALPIIDYTKQKDEFDYIVTQTSVQSLNLLVDTNYMKEQLSLDCYIKWDKTRLRNKIHLKRKAVDYVSIPLFLNRDNTACIIYHRQYMGPLDASGFYEIYIKENNAWKSVQLLLLWIC